MSWTKQDQAVMERMASEGYSASLVGDALGRSRGAVLGRAHRTDVKFGSEGEGETARVRASVTKRTKRGGLHLDDWLKNRLRNRRGVVYGKDYVSPQRPQHALDVMFDELEDGDCRYVYGEEDGKLFCGQPAAKRSSYCVRCLPLTRRPQEGS